MELVLDRVTKHFGGLRAVSDVSFTLGPRVILGLIGPNGAGKTTVFNLVTGVYKPDAGSIRWGGRDLRALAPARIAGAGIARTFQNIRLFGQLTVLENLLVACELQKKTHLAAAVLRTRAHHADEAAMHARAHELLRVFDLGGRADAAPASLSYGDQRRLEIARAMMLAPKLLLLDEPAAGMNYGEAEGLKTQIRWLRDTFDLAVVLVEHNMQVVMGVCEEIHVLDHGETIAHGAPEAVRRDRRVVAAYLGEAKESAASVRAVVEEIEHGVLSTPDRGAMSEAALAEISRDLIAKLEEGLAGVDPDDEAPTRVGRKDALASITDDDEDDATQVARRRLEAPPDLGAIDQGWSSRKLPAAPDDDDDDEDEKTEEDALEPLTTKREL